MNILKRELKSGLKPFLYWTLGLFFLVFVGMVKFTGLQGAGTADITELFDKFPRIVLAVFGMVGLDVTTIGGYYGILTYYTLICAAIYGISLGINAVNREAVDKTYEFLFTKPRSRSYILSIKLVSVMIFLIAFSVLNFIFSILAIESLKMSYSITKEISLFTVVILITGLMFSAVAAFIAALMNKTEKGSFYGNLFFLVTFLTSIIYDMFDNGGFFKIFAPLKYFNPNDLLNNKLDISYLVLCIVIIIVVIFGTFRVFNKKDFNFEA